jgi:hypothetical protein
MEIDRIDARLYGERAVLAIQEYLEGVRAWCRRALSHARAHIRGRLEQTSDRASRSTILALERARRSRTAAIAYSLGGMTRLLAVALIATACAKSKPPTPHPEMIDAIRSFADRVCACGTDRECVAPIRDEFDLRKAALLDHGLTGTDLATFDRELLRLRGCGDAAGLTIWLQI